MGKDETFLNSAVTKIRMTAFSTKNCCTESKNLWKNSNWKYHI